MRYQQDKIATASDDHPTLVQCLRRGYVCFPGGNQPVDMIMAKTSNNFLGFYTYIPGVSGFLNHWNL